MKINVLDAGCVRLVETWGRGDAGEPEAGIIEAARQSTQGSFRGWERDQKLLAFLYDNKHSAPFEFAGMVIEVKAPIFVFREWHRHRTQSYNEMSARYSPLPNENYIPSVERIMVDGGANKQAQSMTGLTLSRQHAEDWRVNLSIFYKMAEQQYQDALIMGVPKELARVCLPVGRYSQMRASSNLRNWLAFLTLRMAPEAQFEIRQFANAVGAFIQNQFPRTWELFKKE